MATVKAAMDLAARQCSLTVPSDWISSTDRTITEFKDFLTETVDELLDRIDWPDPITLNTTITGTGATSYDLPAAFKRLTRDDWAVYETTTTRRRCIPVSTNGEWTYLNQIGSGGGNRYYRVTGDDENGFDISFYQTLATGASVICSYVAKNWLASSSTAGAMWLTEDDTLLLPRRLIELGVIWRFRRRKGLVYADIMTEYETRLSRMANDQRGARRINFGEYEDDTHPMRVPAPDQIPSA